MPDDASVNAATLELLKRQVADDVSAKVRAQLFASYALAGAAVLAVLGVVGWKSLSDIGKDAIATAQTRLVEPMEARSKLVDTALHRAEASQLVLDKLLERSNRTFDAMDTKLADFGMRAAKLSALTEQMADAGERLQDIRNETSRLTGSNLSEIASINTRLSALAEQVRALNDRAASPAPEIAAGVQEVADTSQQVAAAIQRQQQKVTVWLQFANLTRDDARAISSSLARDFTVPGEERTPKAVGTYDIRCYYPADCSLAEKTLKPLLMATVKAMFNDARTPDIKDLTDWSNSRKPKPGTLEVWYEGRRG